MAFTYPKVATKQAIRATKAGLDATSRELIYQNQ